MLQLISLLMLAYSYFLIRTNLPHLPQRIPTHFNAAGVANGWGSPNTLWSLLAAQALTCVVFLVVPYVGQRYPGAIHIGSRRLSDFTPAQRVRMLPILNNLSGYPCVVMNLFFVWMVNAIIKAAAEPVPHLQMLWPLVLFIGGLLGTLFYYLNKLRRAAQGSDDADT